MNKDDYERQRDSDANRHLEMILTGLREPWEDIRDWLAAHGDECDCEFCDADAGNPNTDEIQYSLSALAWMIEQVESILTSCRTTPVSPSMPANITRRMRGDFGGLDS